MAYGSTTTTNGNGINRVSEWRIREQMCDIGKRIWLKGFCAGNEGNHSYRLSEDRILCTPSLIRTAQPARAMNCSAPFEALVGTFAKCVSRAKATW